MDFTLGETQRAVIETATGLFSQHRLSSREPGVPSIRPAKRAPREPKGRMRGEGEAAGWTEERTSELASAGSDEGTSRQRSGNGEADGAPEASGTSTEYDRGLWQELGQAGLLGLAVPERLGGGGLGVLDTAVLLTELGRQAAPVPALATLMMGVLPLTRWAGEAVQSQLLAGVAAGDVVLTAAVREPSEPMPVSPATWCDGSGAVTGVKVGVPYAAQARWILLPATLTSAGYPSAPAPMGCGCDNHAPGGGADSHPRAAGGGAETGTVVAVVDAAGDGVTLDRTPSSSGAPEYTLRLDGAPAAAVLGGAAVADLYQLTLAGACCLADGALAGALALTTAHVASRQQFGRPLATFQAVAQHIADVSIISRTLHLAALSGCWRLDTGRDAGGDLDVAGYWLADQAPVAVRTCHHLHGGTGMDVSYPLHRYSALVKDLVQLAGGADYRLGALGARACG